MPIKNKDIILNGWNVARIREALDEVLERLSDLDPHQDIDSILTTAWKVSKYGVISGPYFPIFRLNTGKYGPEITPYLDTFHAVSRCLKENVKLQRFLTPRSKIIKSWDFFQFYIKMIKMTISLNRKVVLPMLLKLM